MIKNWYSLINKDFPKNYLLRNPIFGSLCLSLLCFLFATLYKPLKLHESRFFNFEITMAIYFCTTSIPTFLLIKILNRIRYFSKADEWNFLKEILSVVIILLVMGITVYFSGFILEQYANRWNWATFLDSCKISFLIGIVPLLSITLPNLRYLFVTSKMEQFETPTNLSLEEQAETFVHIRSKLKKEELHFYPSQFIYSEADGNYVIFYLEMGHKIRKEIIRNSISNIEQQLSSIPYIIRTHRAFIVNVNKVFSQKGNTLGYRLKVNSMDVEIPVSRQRAQEYSQLIKKFK